MLVALLLTAMLQVLSLTNNALRCEIEIDKDSKLTVGHFSFLNGTIITEKGYTLAAKPAYKWTLMKQTPVAAIANNKATLTFVPPKAGEYNFALVVGDGKHLAICTQKVTIK